MPGFVFNAHSFTGFKWTASLEGEEEQFHSFPITFYSCRSWLCALDGMFKNPLTKGVRTLSSFQAGNRHCVFGNISQQSLRQAFREICQIVMRSIFLAWPETLMVSAGQKWAGISTMALSLSVGRRQICPHRCHSPIHGFGTPLWGRPQQEQLARATSLLSVKWAVA